MVSRTFQNIGSLARNCSGVDLNYDEACVQLLSIKKSSLYAQYTECEGCILQEKPLDDDNQFVVQTLWPLRFEVRNDEAIICNGTFNFAEYGHYSINTTDKCRVVMTAVPDAASLPIMEAAVILLGIATLWYLVKNIGKRVLASRFYARHFAGEDNELGSESRVLTSETDGRSLRTPSRSRLRSLDVFRGISIALMIFVNAGGGGYAIFNHSVWNGLTVADVVFPFFAWVMGASMVLSLNAKLRTAMPRWTALWQVFRRSLILALIGVILHSCNASWQTVRIPGVLQRLAVMYLIVGAIECFCMKTQGLEGGASLFRDISAGWLQWLTTLLLVACHVLITFLVAEPGCPRGYMGPGGLHLSEKGFNLTNCTGGIAGYTDRLLLGSNHLHKSGTFTHLYGTLVPHDPEGILGALSGLLVVQGGAQAGRIMLQYRHARARVSRWFMWSLLWTMTGGALCLFTENNGPIPINKNLWSISYCLVCGGLAFFVQAMLYIGVDLMAKWGGRPFYYAGQNSLILYIGSELLKRHWPLYWPMESPTHGQLLFAHAACAMCWLAVGVALYRARVFISI